MRLRSLSGSLGEELRELAQGESLGELNRTLRGSLGEDDGPLAPWGCLEQLVEVLLGDEEGRLQPRREGLALETGSDGRREQDGALAPRGGGGGDLERQRGELLREDNGRLGTKGAGGSLVRCNRSLLLRSCKGKCSLLLSRPRGNRSLLLRGCKA